ncbi:SpaH/EbpB family LPXTG-anchored major pilin [Candidatus Enterococcus murrayae]|uniref:SpaH/EbpB family LPXTG-anchored major pilin n=1 Tax=Candidatus Enterococcus murrayae TaxID=2815321 RepID=A0ABS3HMK5_9ENTE|nr:SpaH/EbpB family LPXTG-anchored major pilin [Enterococcus sp. MJM16]MBO0454691.1 SpaH/EbpB family LPXTG-anchored major pilin [Enterococcus sp. MJM16]
MNIKRKIWGLLGVLIFMASSFAGLGNSLVAEAAPADVDVNIYKGAYDTMPTDRQNTGEKDETWHTGQGGRPLKDVGFTVYDATEKFYDLAEDNPTWDVNKLRDEIAPAGAAGLTAVGTEKTTDATGHVKFTLPDKVTVNSVEKDAVYLFVETSAPSNVTTKADNMVVIFPVYKMNADGTPTNTALSELFLYPKNVQTDDIDVVKEKEVKDDFTVGEPIEYKITFEVPVGIDGLANNDPLNPVYRYTQFFLRDEAQTNLHYLDNQGLHVVESDGTLTPINDVDFSVVEEPGGTPIKTGYDNIFHVFFNAENSLTKQTPNVVKLSKYAGKKLVFKYRMYLDENTTPDEWIDNQATLQYENNPSDGLQTLPWTGDDVITYGRRFKKVDQDNGTSLDGAEFIVKRKNNGVTEYMIAQATTSSPSRWSTNKADALVLTSAGGGLFTVEGLEGTVSHDAAGNALPLETKPGSSSVGDPSHPATVGKPLVQYWLEETKTPNDNYVALTSDIPFTVDYGTYTSTIVVDAETKVENKRKGTLPGTGGNGIYAIIAIGAVAVLAVGAYFLRNKETVEE